LISEGQGAGNWLLMLFHANILQRTGREATVSASENPANV
jgi:hypothetical protein